MGAPDPGPGAEANRPKSGGRLEVNRPKSSDIKMAPTSNTVASAKPSAWQLNQIIPNIGYITTAGGKTKRRDAFNKVLHNNVTLTPAHDKKKNVHEITVVDEMVLSLPSAREKYLDWWLSKTVGDDLLTSLCLPKESIYEYARVLFVHTRGLTSTFRDFADEIVSNKGAKGETRREMFEKLWNVYHQVLEGVAHEWLGDNNHAEDDQETVDERDHELIALQCRYDELEVKQRTMAKEIEHLRGAKTVEIMEANLLEQNLKTAHGRIDEETRLRTESEIRKKEIQQQLHEYLITLHKERTAATELDRVLRNTQQERESLSTAYKAGQKKIESCESLLAHASRKGIEQHAQIQRLRAQISQNRGTYDAMVNKFEEMKDLVKETESTRDSCQEDLTETKGKLLAAESLIEQLQVQCTEIQSQCDYVEKKNFTLEKSFQESEAMQKNIQADLMEEVSKRRLEERELTTLRVLVQEKSKKADEWEQQFSELQATFRRTDMEKKSLEKEREGMSAQLENENGCRRQLQAEVRRLKAKNFTMTNERDMMEETLRDTTTYHKILVDKITKVTEELTVLKRVREEMTRKAESERTYYKEHINMCEISMLDQKKDRDKLLREVQLITEELTALKSDNQKLESEKQTFAVERNEQEAAKSRLESLLQVEKDQVQMLKEKFKTHYVNSTEAEEKLKQSNLKLEIAREKFESDVDAKKTEYEKKVNVLTTQMELLRMGKEDLHSIVCFDPRVDTKRAEIEKLKGQLIKQEDRFHKERTELEQRITSFKVKAAEDQIQIVEKGKIKEELNEKNDHIFELDKVLNRLRDQIGKLEEKGEEKDEQIRQAIRKYDLLKFQMSSHFNEKEDACVQAGGGNIRSRLMYGDADLHHMSVQTDPIQINDLGTRNSSPTSNVSSRRGVAFRETPRGKNVRFGSRMTTTDKTKMNRIAERSKEESSITSPASNSEHPSSVPTPEVVVRKKSKASNSTDMPLPLGRLTSPTSKDDTEMPQSPQSDVMARFSSPRNATEDFLSPRAPQRLENIIAKNLQRSQTSTGSSLVPKSSPLLDRKLKERVLQDHFGFDQTKGQMAIVLGSRPVRNPPIPKTKYLPQVKRTATHSHLPENDTDIVEAHQPRTTALTAPGRLLGSSILDNLSFNTAEGHKNTTITRNFDHLGHLGGFAGPNEQGTGSKNSANTHLQSSKDSAHMIHPINDDPLNLRQTDPSSSDRHSQNTVRTHAHLDGAHDGQELVPGTIEQRSSKTNRPPAIHIPDTLGSKGHVDDKIFPTPTQKTRVSFSAKNDDGQSSIGSITSVYVSPK